MHFDTSVPPKNGAIMKYPFNSDNTRQHLPLIEREVCCRRVRQQDGNNIFRRNAGVTALRQHLGNTPVAVPPGNRGVAVISALLCIPNGLQNLALFTDLPGLFKAINSGVE